MICRFLHLSVSLLVCPSVRMSICPSVRLFLCISVCLYFCPSVFLSVCQFYSSHQLSASPFMCLSVCFSFCPSIRLSIYTPGLSVCPSVRLSIRPLYCMSVYQLGCRFILLVYSAVSQSILSVCLSIRPQSICLPVRRSVRPSVRFLPKIRKYFPAPLVIWVTLLRVSISDRQLVSTVTGLPISICKQQNYSYF